MDRDQTLELGMSGHTGQPEIYPAESARDTWPRATFRVVSTEQDSGSRLGFFRSALQSGPREMASSWDSRAKLLSQAGLLDLMP